MNRLLLALSKSALVPSVALSQACSTNYVNMTDATAMTSHPEAGTISDAAGNDALPSPPHLLQLADLRYAGAFRLPEGAIGQSSFDYGGTAMAFNEANKSLFMVGHDQQQMVAEVKIPDVRIVNKIADLATATPLQSFTDASAGKMSTVGSVDIKIGGLLVANNNLIGSAYVYYDAANEQKLSHFTRSVNLSDHASVKGMFAVGTLGAGYVSGYMTAIPHEWQAALGGPAITGQCCIPIISRTSFGPSAFVFDPTDLGAKAPVQTVPLLYYTEEHATLGAWGRESKTFNGTSVVSGLAFPSGTRSILYVGSQGTGPWCYGVGGATGECYDPTNIYKGNHAYPYVHQIWAYDADDLVKVRNGAKEPWQVVPYGVWNFELPFQTESRRISGVAYDDAGRRMYVAEYRSDGERPIVHAFDVK